jgi:hypothetical protein
VKLSVVIAARSGTTPALRCLESLRAEPEWASIEVIVVNCAGPDAAHKFAAQDVRVIEASPHWPIARQRWEGVRNSRGEIVAILQERYRVRPGWVRAAMEAHASGAGVAGGSVAPSPDLTNSGWAIYLSEYSHLCKPGTAGPQTVPGGNVSYQRRVFELADMQAAMWELDFHAALALAGAKFIRTEAMQATFATPPSAREYLRERFTLSRDIARQRGAQKGAAGRVPPAIARIALPALILYRIAGAVRGVPVLRRRFLSSLPWILIFAAVQAGGEIGGYLGSREHPQEPNK